MYYYVVCAKNLALFREKHIVPCQNDAVKSAKDIRNRLQCGLETKFTLQCA